MNNLEQANAGFMSYIEVSVERRREPQTSTYESFLQLRREYDGADPRRQKEIEQAVRFGLAAMDNTIDS